MSEQTIENPQQYPEQLSDVLLVMDKEKKKIQAVTGVDENRKLKTVDATKKNQSQFMRVDRAGDLFTNFFSNFWRQLKDPTHLSFFKVPAKEAVETAKEMQKQVDAPTKEGEVVMVKHEVKEPKEQQQETKKDVEKPQATPETQQAQEKNEYRYKVEDVDWKTLGQFGINKEKLEKDGQLDLLLAGSTKYNRSSKRVDDINPSIVPLAFVKKPCGKIYRILIFYQTSFLPKTLVFIVENIVHQIVAE